MPRTPQVVPYKRWPKSDIAVAIAHPSGRTDVQFGGSLGSAAFTDKTLAAESLGPWVEERRGLLIAQLAELEEVARYARAMLGQPIFGRPEP